MSQLLAHWVQNSIEILCKRRRVCTDIQPDVISILVEVYKVVGF